MSAVILSRQSFSFLVWFIICLGLLVTSTRWPGFAEFPRTLVTDTLLPIVEATNKPAEWWQDIRRNIADHVQTVEENRILRNNILQTRVLQEKIALLEEENRLLNILLKRIKESPGTPVTSRVYNDATGPFLASVLITGGTQEGIEKGLPVINQSGLVGRVTSVGKRTARILLLTDPTFRLPVRIIPGHARALARGDGNNGMEIFLLENPKETLPNGARIVTSGLNGLFPPDIPIGILSVKKETATITPAVNLSLLDFVSVLKTPVKGYLKEDMPPP